MGNDLVITRPTVRFHRTKSYKMDKTSFNKLSDLPGLVCLTARSISQPIATPYNTL